MSRLNDFLKVGTAKNKRAIKMSIGTVGELGTIANGLPIILFGFALMRK